VHRLCQQELVCLEHTQLASTFLSALPRPASGCLLGCVAEDKEGKEEDSHALCNFTDVYWPSDRRPGQDALSC
jgi:hypothetical protein